MGVPPPRSPEGTGRKDEHLCRLAAIVWLLAADGPRPSTDRPTVGLCGERLAASEGGGGGVRLTRVDSSAPCRQQPKTQRRRTRTGPPCPLGPRAQNASFSNEYVYSNPNWLGGFWNMA
ncbi:hypothetical protein GPALN_010858 [Globodera pallida]|nr:hypothetical protein GPALN_010858 [Globodera pallida]